MEETKRNEKLSKTKNNRSQIIFISLIIFISCIHVYMVHTVRKLKKENTELKANGGYIPIIYERFQEHSFGKVYEVQKSTADSIPNDTFYFSKDNKTIHYNSVQEDGSIFKYDVFISEKPLTDSLIMELGPILLNAFKKTEREILDANIAKQEFDTKKANFINQLTNE